VEYATALRFGVLLLEVFLGGLGVSAVKAFVGSD
jgi:hypothetical protein